MIASLLIVALMLWVVGYQYGRNPTANKELASSGLDKIILAPKWLFYLCGAPKLVEYPRGSLTIFSIRSQVMGILLGMLAGTLHFWKLTLNEFVIGVALILLLTNVLTYYFSKRYSVK